MYNDHDEMYEVEDFDEDIRERKALIEEAKKIEESSNWNEIFRKVTDLKRRWKRIPYRESAYEEELMEEFEQCLEGYYAKRNEGFQGNQELKQGLVDRAAALSTSEDWNKTTTEMNELMQQWKAIGSAGKTHDDALWEAFNNARQTFFDRKRKHWETLQSKFAEAHKIKEELIKQAAALADSEEWKKTGDELRALMDQWKAAGSAGREHEDRLWNEFNEHRQKFYDRRAQYYDSLHGEQDQRYAQKQALVEKARAVAERKEYTKEQTAEMKALQTEWKTIGSCGKEREDEIWKEFRSMMDEYFNGMKQLNEQKHAQWRQRMVDARTRKQELIANQKRQIKRMQDEMVGLLGQRAIDDMQVQIEDKEAFIKELEAQLADIDQTLENQ